MRSDKKIAIAISVAAPLNALVPLAWFLSFSVSLQLSVQSFVTS